MGFREDRSARSRLVLWLKHCDVFPLTQRGQTKMDVKGRPPHDPSSSEPVGGLPPSVGATWAPRSAAPPVRHPRPAGLALLPLYSLGAAARGFGRCRLCPLHPLERPGPLQPLLPPRPAAGFGEGLPAPNPGPECGPQASPLGARPTGGPGWRRGRASSRLCGQPLVPGWVRPAQRPAGRTPSRREEGKRGRAGKAPAEKEVASAVRSRLCRRGESGQARAFPARGGQRERSAERRGRGRGWRSRASASHPARSPAGPPLPRRGPGSECPRPSEAPEGSPGRPRAWGRRGGRKPRRAVAPSPRESGCESGGARGTRRTGSAGRSWGRTTFSPGSARRW